MATFLRNNSPGLFWQRLAVGEDAARLGVADDPLRVEARSRHSIAFLFRAGRQGSDFSTHARMESIAKGSTAVSTGFFFLVWRALEVEVSKR